MHKPSGTPETASPVQPMTDQARLNIAIQRLLAHAARIGRQIELQADQHNGNSPERIEGAAIAGDQAQRAAPRSHHNTPNTRGS